MMSHIHHSASESFYPFVPCSSPLFSTCVDGSVFAAGIMARLRVGAPVVLY